MATPDPGPNKLHKVWSHTGALIGLAASLVTVIGFLGIHFGTGESAKPAVKAAPSAPAVRPPVTASQAPHGRVRTRGIGTFHIEGGFPVGDPRLAKDAILAQPEVVQTVRLTNPANGKEETLANAMVVGDVPAGELAGVWREGTRLLKGAKLSVASISLTGNGVSATIPVDSGGKLLVSVVWPGSRMFTNVEFPGAVETSGWTLPNGLYVGDSSTNEGGKTLPVHFSIDVPKPGEVLGAFRGELEFAGGWSDKRYVAVLAADAGGNIAASWSSELTPSGSPQANEPDAALDRSYSQIRIQYQFSPP